MAYSKERMSKRNVKMCREYDRLYHVKRKRIDDVYRQLAEGFHLSEARVRRILSKMHGTLEQMEQERNEKPKGGEQLKLWH